MSTSIVPAKTDLGRQELSHRVNRVSQRHRTVLLLVDGQRPLSLVLSLAQQAGASTQIFGDLLRMGLVELPEPPAEEAPAAAAACEPPAVEEHQARSLAADSVVAPLSVATEEPRLEPPPRSHQKRSPAPSRSHAR